MSLVRGARVLFNLTDTVPAETRDNPSSVVVSCRSMEASEVFAKVPDRAELNHMSAVNVKEIEVACYSSTPLGQLTEYSFRAYYSLRTRHGVIFDMSEPTERR
ncbi:MAG: hypothetical protein AAB686_00565 [Patescibacteria group bacterium]